MKKTLIATALVIGLTAVVAFTSGNVFAENGDRSKVANQNMAQMTMPAKETAKMPMNGQDMSKMPMNDRMAMMEKRMAMMDDMMNSCGTMMKQPGMNMK